MEILIKFKENEIYHPVFFIHRNLFLIKLLATFQYIYIMIKLIFQNASPKEATIALTGFFITRNLSTYIHI